jgi:hypothetical protein
MVPATMVPTIMAALTTMAVPTTATEAQTMDLITIMAAATMFSVISKRKNAPTFA